MSAPYFFNISAGETMFPVDFDQKDNWKVISGSGEFNNNNKRKLEGRHSLSIKASDLKNVVLRSRPKVTIYKIFTNFKVIRSNYFYNWRNRNFFKSKKRNSNFNEH